MRSRFCARHECAFGGYGPGYDRCTKRRKPGARMCAKHVEWAESIREDMTKPTRRVVRRDKAVA
jgi:hypothetical protein